MAQNVVLRVLTMTDEKKAIEAAADILGVDSIAADLKDQKLTVVGEMDAVGQLKKKKKDETEDEKKEDKKPEDNK